MESKGLSQEGLKLIACTTMLLDHLGAVFVPWTFLRVIGRLAFPIYCFLLTEGVFYTRNISRYGLRLLGGALLAEIPFDLLFFGKLTLAHQSVMVTLLLGFLFAAVQKDLTPMWQKLFALAGFCILGQILRCDYGGCGVAMIGLFALSRQLPEKIPVQLGTLAVLSLLIGGMQIKLGPVQVPIQLFSLLSLALIQCYCGRKATADPRVRRLFYLFYPVHLAVLCLLK